MVSIPSHDNHMTYHESHDIGNTGASLSTSNVNLYISRDGGSTWYMVCNHTPLLWTIKNILYFRH